MLNDKLEKKGTFKINTSSDLRLVYHDERLDLVSHFTQSIIYLDWNTSEK